MKTKILFKDDITAIAIFMMISSASSICFGYEPVDVTTTGGSTKSSTSSNTSSTAKSTTNKSTAEKSNTTKDDSKPTTSTGTKGSSTADKDDGKSTTTGTKGSSTTDKDDGKSTTTGTKDSSTADKDDGKSTTSTIGGSGQPTAKFGDESSSTDPWSGWAEYGEFGNPEDLNDHIESMQNAIAETDNACGQSCDDLDRFQILNQTYYSNLASTGNQNLPLGPIETMARYYSPENTVYSKYTRYYDVIETQLKIDDMVRNGQLSVVLPGQTMGSDFYRNTKLTHIQRLSLQTTPIFVGTLTTITEAYSSMPINYLGNIQYGISTPIGHGYGGGFYIISNTATEEGQPMIDFSNPDDENFETLLHEANHSGEYALAMINLDLQETGEIEKLNANEAKILQQGGNTAYAIRLGFSLITPQDCDSCKDFLALVDSHYLDSYTEIRARLSEGTDVGTATYVNRLMELHDLSEIEARQLIKDLGNSKNLQLMNQTLENGAGVASQVLGHNE